MRGLLHQLLGHDPQRAPATVLSISALEQAVRFQDHTIVQLRRFFEKNGVVTVREELRVDADGTQSPHHSLTWANVFVRWHVRPYFLFID